MNAVRGRIEEVGYLTQFLQSKENVFEEFHNKIKNKKEEIKRKKEEIEKNEINFFDKFKV
jgi:peptidoglycan hydrolase CwlO-like protein